MATTWVYRHGDRRMYAQRPDRLHRVQLVIWGTDVADQLYWFDDEVGLVEFLSEFEARSVAEGWSLADFIPERRTGMDRRATPRAADRRHLPADGPGTLITFPKKPIE